MADSTTEIDLDSVIDRLLEGVLSLNSNCLSFRYLSSRWVALGLGSGKLYRRCVTRTVETAQICGLSAFRAQRIPMTPTYPLLPTTPGGSLAQKRLQPRK